MDEPEKTPLEIAIDKLLTDMDNTNSDSESYAKMVSQLVKLYPLKETDKPKRLTPDTAAIVLGNLAGIILIIRHEQLNVLASKALTFVLRLR